LPRFNLGNPGNVLRIFEKGGEKAITTRTSNKRGTQRPATDRLSSADSGRSIALTRCFSVCKNAVARSASRIPWSNDHAGDYRTSGCSACHVTYANDRSPTNSGWWSKYGHQGLSFTLDKSIRKMRRGIHHPSIHPLDPIKPMYELHMHQGNLFVNPFLGYTWWDQETDGELMYPGKQHNPTDAELVRSTMINPEAAAARGLGATRISSIASQN